MATKSKYAQFDKVTDAEDKLIHRIADRAIKEFDEYMKPDKLHLEMNLRGTHSSGCPLDFEKLLAFDAYNFSHDMRGIERHLNKTTGELEDCFLPRCAKQS